LWNREGVRVWDEYKRNTLTCEHYCS
jgi:hypothetical protein